MCAGANKNFRGAYIHHIAHRIAIPDCTYEAFLAAFLAAFLMISLPESNAEFQLDSPPVAVGLIEFAL